MCWRGRDRVPRVVRGWFQIPVEVEERKVNCRGERWPEKRKDRLAKVQASWEGSCTSREESAPRENVNCREEGCCTGWGKSDRMFGWDGMKEKKNTILGGTAR